ncbi:MAG: SDR family oxidoreductase [Reyranellaceae bacterium]
MAAARRAALITGAGRNIGRACALGLAKDGFDVAINGSSDLAAAEKVAAEAAELGARTLVVMGDVGKPEDCKRIAEAAIAAFGTVDVLINNAAVRPGKPFLEASEDEWRRVMSVDLDAAVWLARACLPGMLHKGWGRIINFTGMNAMAGHGGRASVSVAKHGVWGLTKSLAKEFGAQGVTVNAISPGPIAADDVNQKEYSSAQRQQTVARVPVGRMGTPVEVAAAARLLASEAGAYINGQMIAVNGGAET